MLRRVHVSRVVAGDVPLDAGQARHIRDVLRLEAGAAVEVFDDAGSVATGELVFVGKGTSVRIGDLPDIALVRPRREWTIAAAVPKGERADWMVEKLSELGTAEFVPLATARSVVIPEGRNKRQRWVRIATESAKQSRRPGVMRIGELRGLEDAIARVTSLPRRAGLYGTTAPDGRAIAEVMAALPSAAHSITVFIGPEGGWIDGELSGLSAAGFTPVRLADTVLRVETAAVAAAALIGALSATRGSAE